MPAQPCPYFVRLAWHVYKRQLPVLHIGACRQQNPIRRPAQNSICILAAIPAPLVPPSTCSVNHFSTILSSDHPDASTAMPKLRQVCMGCPHKINASAAPSTKLAMQFDVDPSRVDTTLYPHRQPFFNTILSSDHPDASTAMPRLREACLACASTGMRLTPNTPHSTKRAMHLGVAPSIVDTTFRPWRPLFYFGIKPYLPTPIVPVSVFKLYGFDKKVKQGRAGREHVAGANNAVAITVATCLIIGNIGPRCGGSFMPRRLSEIWCSGPRTLLIHGQYARKVCLFAFLLNQHMT
jgi:hypothetical protein